MSLRLRLTAIASACAVLDGAGRTWARISDQNPLTREPPDLALARAAPRVIMWSGHPGTDLFARDLESWSPRAWDALKSWCDRVAPEADRAGARILLRPHARHVLSDVQRCVRFLSEHQGGPFGLAFDPIMLLERSMIPSAPDHLSRAIETLGPRSDAIWISGASPGTPGVIDTAAVTALIDRFVPPGVPLIDDDQTGAPRRKMA